MKLTLVVFGLATVLGIAYSQECAGNEFLCEDLGFCIPGSWVCDGQDDCGDNSDEDQDCPTTTTTPCPGFVCPNSGRCIPASYVCDGDNDCGDMSDEQDCPTTTPRTTTPCAGKPAIGPSARSSTSAFRFSTETNLYAYKHIKMLQRYDDCRDMSDEQNCPSTTTTPCPGFVCPESGRCLPASYVCDGDNDCGDYSDESEEACPCSDNEIRCPQPPGSNYPGACIPPEYICDADGIWDCPDGFDEANCTKAFDPTHPHFRLETIHAQKLHRMMKDNRNEVLGKDIKERKKMSKW